MDFLTIKHKNLVGLGVGIGGEGVVCVVKITLVALKLGNYCGLVMMIGLARTRGSQRGGGKCRKWILQWGGGLGGYVFTYMVYVPQKQAGLIRDLKKSFTQNPNN